jgi:hypothetical protein
MDRKWFHGSRISGFPKPQWKPHVSPCGPNKTKVLSNVKQSWLAFAENGFISVLSDHGDKRKRAKTNPHRRGVPLEEFASDRQRCDIMEFKTAIVGCDRKHKSRAYKERDPDDSVPRIFQFRSRLLAISASVNDTNTHRLPRICIRI